MQRKIEVLQYRLPGFLQKFPFFLKNSVAVTRAYNKASTRAFFGFRGPA